MSLLDQLKLNTNLPMDKDYKEELEEIEYLRNSYEASGSEYTLGSAPDGYIIHKMECEEKADWKTRCLKTPTRSYVSSIINKYNSAVMKNEPSRATENTTYDIIYDDADGYGTPLNELMRKALLKAQIDGEVYLLADSTASDTEILTIAQKLAADTRPYIRIVPAESVSATTEVEEKLLEAIVMLVDENGKTFARYMNEEVFIDIQVNKNKIESLSDPYAHGYSAIPLVKVEPFDDAQSEPIANGQRIIVNILSLLQQELNDSVFSKFILSGVRIDPEQDNQKVSWSGKRLVVLEDANAKLEQMGADHGCADSLRKQIEVEETNLYYAAGFGRPNVEPTSLSGLSRLLAMEDFFIACRALTRSIETAENTILGLIAEKESFEYVPAVYSTKYISDDSLEELARVRDLLALQIPSVMKRLVVADYVERFYNLSDEDKAKLAAELETMYGAE